jgi:2'-5' RNA ligase
MADKQLPKKEGTYIGLHLSDYSIKALKKLQTQLGITEEFPFHITLVYSRKKINMDINTKINKTIKAEEFHIFDNTKTGGDRALVIKFNCPYCKSRHNYAKKALGATWDYPTYESHITLCYKWEGDEPDKNLLKDFKINIKSEYYEPLNLDWSDTNVIDKKEEQIKIKDTALNNKLKNTPSITATKK